MGERIVVMKDGIIQQVDTPQNLYDMPCNMFVAGFIGSPQIDVYKRQESGNGVEHPHPNAPQPIIPAEYRHQRHGTCQAAQRYTDPHASLQDGDVYKRQSPRLHWTERAALPELVW